jgi:hypothetical protein
MSEGAHWVYRSHARLVEDLPMVESLHHVHVLGSYRDGDGGTCWLVRSYGTDSAVEHWYTDAGGITVRPGTGTGICAANREVVAHRPLAAPVGGVTEWTWTVPHPTSEDAHWTARLDALDVPVEVPAGRFRTLVVRAATASGDQRRTVWFARGVGIVREELHGSAHEVRELRSFQPGTDPMPRQQALLHLLPPDWLGSAAGPATVDWLRDGCESLALPGRFALIEVGGERRCAFVGTDFCQPVDPSVTADWYALLERLRAHEHPSDPTLARLVARLLAHSERLAILDFEPEVGPPARMRRTITAHMQRLQVTN